MRPSRTDTLIAIALTVAQRSTCNRLAVGAVIARDARVLSTGYNGPPAGMNHCAHDLTSYRVTGVEGPACQLAVHAEANAIAFAARFGTPTQDTEIYITHSPCVNCAKLIINSGIVRVHYAFEYRDPSGTDLLESVGVECLYHE